MRKRIPEAQRQENFGLIGERTIRPRGNGTPILKATRRLGYPPTGTILGTLGFWLCAARHGLAGPGEARARQERGKELGLASQPANTQNTRNTVTNNNTKNMYQKNYAVTLTGATDLLMHRDNIDFGAKTRAWQKDPANKKMSVAGDDRSPAWSWLSCLYTSGGQVVIDSDNIMSMLRDGGKKCSAPTGRGSMKAQTQSGIICNEIGWPITLADGRNIDSNKLLAMVKESEFEEHEKAAQEAGFVLFVKRARVGTSKHVRVRPRFSNWSASGTLTVVDPSITQEMLQHILTFAGCFCGVGDWRPSSPTPGQFGRFTATITKLP